MDATEHTSDSESEYTAVETDGLLSSTKQCDVGNATPTTMTTPLPETTTAAQNAMVTPPEKPPSISPAVDDAQYVLAGIRTTILSVYKSALPPVAKDMKNEDIVFAYEAAEHVVDVLRHFEIIIDYLFYVDGCHEIAAVFAANVVDAYTAWATHRVQLQENQRFAPVGEETALFHVIKSKSQAKAFQEISDPAFGFPKQGRAADCRTVRVALKACTDMASVTITPAFFSIPALHTWAAHMHILLPCFVRSCTDTGRTPYGVPTVASTYLDYARRVLVGLDRGEKK